MEGIHWDVQVDRCAAEPLPYKYKLSEPPNDKQATHYRITSYTYPTEEDKGNLDKATHALTILIRINPFTITVVRNVTPSRLAEPILSALNAKATFWLPSDAKVDPTAVGGKQVVLNAKPEPRVVWETMQQPLSWRQFGDTYTTVLNIRKPGAAKYMGFGEQAGQSFLKTSTYMNYFGNSTIFFFN